MIKRLLSIKTKYLIGLFLILGLFCLLLDQRTNKSEVMPNDPTSVDTYIPEGMVLVPIEIQNIDSLKNILGDFGVVDIYAIGTDQNVRSKKVASSVKMIRAPLNPDVFAVLVSEALAPEITRYPGSFVVTILNPKSVSKKQPAVLKNANKLQIISEM